jgi:hypothetical protein
MVRSLYSILWAMIILLAFMTTWLVLSTQMVLSPKSIHYSDNGEVTFVRTVPFGDVWAKWSTEIRVSATGRECHSGRNEALYQVVEGDTVLYSLGDWAQKCLQEGPPLVIVNTWKAYLFGIIPLRPTRMVTIIEVDRKHDLAS